MKKLVFIAIFLIFLPSLYSKSPEYITHKVTQHWLEINNNFSNTSDVWGNYTIDLTLEALLFHDYYLKKDLYLNTVLEVFKKINIISSDTIAYNSQPFCSINFILGKLTCDKNWFTGYIHESHRMKQNVKKSIEGAVMINHQDDYYILIDYMQEYTSRLSKTGLLTNDTLLFSEAVNQFIVYEKLLRNENTGLWCQGRGWCPDRTKLAQGAWSRGHGWLLRGIVTTMSSLPYEFQLKLKPVLERTSNALLKVQSRNGMYHILLNLPINRSEPDVSGTGMIAYYMAIAVKNNWLDEEIYRPSILRATSTIKNYVTKNGEVLNSCKGPGPLCNQDEYIYYKPKIDEKHGFQGIIYGMLAEMMMN